MAAERVTPVPVFSAARTEDLLLAARTIREGGVIAVPTDTVYGLAASIFQPGAIERIFEIKRRKPDQAVPVLLSSAADLPLVVQTVPPVVWSMIDRFWPGPLTLVLPARRGLSPTITGRGNTVGVRVPAARSLLMFLEILGEPVVGTSANIHGQPPALTANEVTGSLDAGLDGVLADDTVVKTGVASTVVEVIDGRAVVHRVGVLSPDAIRRALGPRATVEHKWNGT